MSVRIIMGDVLDGLAQLADESVHCVVTSPPYYGLRDYGVDGQIGLEATPAAFVARLVEVFREVRRVLRADGTCWVNIGDSYSNGGRTSRAPDAKSSGREMAVRPDDGLKPKDLIGIPWRLAFALQDDGWWLRQEIIWQKPNPMPESVTDRCTKAHEQIFLLAKSERYFFDNEAIKERAAWPDGPNSPESIKSPYGQGFTRRSGVVVSDERKELRSDVESRHRSSIPGGQSLQAEPDGRRNKRSVWSIATTPFPEAHFATFPPELPATCIKAGTSQHGCCAKCGAPWERTQAAGYQSDDRPQMKRARELFAKHNLTDDHLKAIRAVGITDAGKAQVTTDGFGKNDPEMQRLADEAKAALKGYYREFLISRPVTTGWEPSCSCDAPAVPCTVLDPFGGAGTTGLVADRLQRNAILIELNPTYAAMAERRINGDRGGLLDLMEMQP